MSGTLKADSKLMNILLVEDNPADVLLTMEALREGNTPHEINAVNDGLEALDYLRSEGRYAGAVCPDIIFLDINLPKKNGFEVLKEIKEDPALKLIPVIILTTSSSRKDIVKAYALCANCYITKPIDLDDFFKIIRSIENFWFTVARLPSR
jgi:chemotaxis family two-component system response regulator Rcp1